MSRFRRVAVGGVVYHVLNRAANKRRVFFSPDDYWEFIRVLCIAVTITGMRVLAYCVMPNHWHLVVWPMDDDALAKFLHRLTMKHALAHRRRSNSLGEGHVYQGPYRSFPVQTERYYYNVLRYVEGNALRAGLVTRAEDWPWSSLRGRCDERSVIAAGPLAMPPDWSDLVNQTLPTDDLTAIRASAHNGRPYGSDGWTTQVARTHGLEHTLKTPGRPRRPRREWWC